MSFDPTPNEPLTIGDTTYYVAGHPYAPDLPYGQEGRAATVYKLVSEDGSAQALKVFKPAYRVPSLAGQAAALAPLAAIPGLLICGRTVLSALRHQQLLRQYPELLYAVLMPWIEGPTWFDVLVECQELIPEQSLGLAKGFLGVLVRMEQNGIAHCDLSGSNLLLPGLVSNAIGKDSPVVELVDVEQVFGPDLTRPELLTAGTAGYLHKLSADSLWSAHADRFAGAVLVAEILGWCVPAVCHLAWEGSYFSQRELQREGERYEALCAALAAQWGADIANLFMHAWRSETLEACPSFADWFDSLPTGETEVEMPDSGVDPMDDPITTPLYDLAQELEEQGEYAGAALAYRYLRRVQQDQHGSPASLDIAIRWLEMRAAADKAMGMQPPEASSLDPLADLFDDGLAAVQQQRWREARELLSEVVRQDPTYTRGGWDTQKLLDDVKKRSRPLWVRGMLFGAKLLGASMLVILLVTGAFAGAYLVLARPIITAVIFTFAQPILDDLTEISGEEGCWILTELELNEGLAERVPALVNDNSLELRITGDAFRASMEVAGWPVWIAMYPPSEMRGQDFALRHVEISPALNVLFTAEDLTEFTERFVRREILGLEGMSTVFLELEPGQAEVCARR